MALYAKSVHVNATCVQIPQTAWPLSFSENGKQAILAQLLGSPDRRFFVREIARGAGVAARTLTRDLAELTEAGILERAQG